MSQTIVYFVSHASVLIRYDDEFLLTDPWYVSSAFASWSPCPPVTLNPDILKAFTYGKKLSILISHAHPDHMDLEFLKSIDPKTQIVISQFENTVLRTDLESIGLSNIHEVTSAGLKLGVFSFQSFISHLTDYDSALTIETPDAFVFHGNDFWRLNEQAQNRMKAIKPSKPSLFMGQGGSADGYPLTYVSLSEEERVRRYFDKNKMMVTGVSELAQQMGFDKALAYACFTRIQVPQKKYSNHFEPPTQAVCQKHGLQNMINMQPGDVYIPAEQRVISILSTLDINLDCYDVVSPTSDFSAEFDWSWTEEDSRMLDGFIEHWNRYCQNKTITDENFLNTQFGFSVRNHSNEEILQKILMNPQGKSCYVSVFYFIEIPTLKAVLHRKIPFEYLDTGYLAEVHREPIDHFNQSFYNATCEFGYEYMFSK